MIQSARLDQDGMYSGEMHPVESESQATRAHRILRQRIIDGVVAPNEKLKVTPISDELDVSPGAVREALSRLTTEYLVVASEQKGFRASPLSLDDLRDLYGTRREIETDLVRRSVENADSKWLETLASVYGRLCAALRGLDNPSTPDKLAVHEEFHRTLVSGCGSIWSLRWFSTIYSASARYRNFACQHLAVNRSSDDEHAAIFNAAIRGDAEAAAKHIDDHIRLTQELLEKFILEMPEGVPEIKLVED